MYKLYILVSYKTKSYYIGMTKNKLSTRLAQHKNCAQRGRKTPLYDAMRKYNDFIIVLVKEYNTKEECANAEIAYIKEARDNRHSIYNLADGGQTGYIITDPEVRARVNEKLKASRVGRKPALGMRHSEENKKFFSECSKRRKLLYPDLDVFSIGFTEANRKFGISKTHYYRLLKRAKSNDLS